MFNEVAGAGADSPGAGAANYDNIAGWKGPKQGQSTTNSSSKTMLQKSPSTKLFHTNAADSSNASSSSEEEEEEEEGADGGGGTRNGNGPAAAAAAAAAKSKSTQLSKSLPKKKRTKESADGREAAVDPFAPSRTVRVFRQKFTLEDAIGSHACSLEANIRVTNSIPLGCQLPLTVATMNSVQTLKVQAPPQRYRQRIRRRNCPMMHPCTRRRLLERVGSGQPVSTSIFCWCPRFRLEI
jgi:hypothetical protein